VHGENAQGKTSLLESILFAATSRSHRTNLETDLVAHGAEGFQLALEVSRPDREVSLQVNWWLGAKRVKVNGVAQTRMSDILGKVRLVFFCPEDIALVKGSASVRRKFLDMELSQLNPAYLAALQQYRQVLRQRNELLRARDPDAAQLDAWDQQLVRHARVIITERALFAEELGRFASRAYAAIAQKEEMTLVYRPHTEAADLEESLRDARESDLRRKQTTHGPHRDDIELKIGTEPARSHGSQGQQKSAALAIKLAELELVKARTGEYPILMLDEVLAELDAKRSEHLFDAIHDDVQCILTTTDLHARGRIGARAAADFVMDSGCLSTVQRNGD
jgi:DNA replication and repair protein RecF